MVEVNFTHKALRSNGDEIYGYYHADSQSLIVPAIMANGVSMAPIVYFVDPDTVCRFVGAYDVEDKLLFEHDWVEVESADEVYRGCIIWLEDNLCFRLKLFTPIGYAEIPIDKEYLSHVRRIG